MAYEATVVDGEAATSTLTLGDLINADPSSFDVAILRKTWRSQVREEPPNFRTAELLARALVYRLQCNSDGGPSRTLRRRLDELAGKFASDPGFTPAPRLVAAPGVRLVREWNGAQHVVEAIDGGFRYHEQTFSSLTQIARLITGTHQSGPRFFGLAKPASKPTP